MAAKTTITSSEKLVDISVVYMTDVRAHWEDFRKAVKEASTIWGLQGWISTVCRGGKIWRKMRDEDLLKPFYESQEDAVKEEGKDAAAVESDADVEEDPEDPAVKLRRTLGISTRNKDFFQVELQFVNTVTWEVEDMKKLPARCKLWNWMCKALAGPTGHNEGPYYYLTTKVEQYDTGALFNELTRVVETPTILSHARELDALFTIVSRPGQEIFSFLADIHKQVKRIKDMNGILDKDDEVHIPDAFIRAKLMLAMNVCPIYKTLLDKWLLVEPADWKTLSTDEVYRQLQFVSANSRDVRSAGGSSSSTQFGSRDTAVANTAQVSSKAGKSQSKPKGVCFEFLKKGVCSRTACNFRHEKQEQKSDRHSHQQSKKGGAKQPQPQQQGGGKPAAQQPTKDDGCTKCGGNHPTKECKFEGKCNYCGRQNHKEAMCRDKKAGKPRPVAMSARVNEGEPVRANLARVRTKRGRVSVHLTAYTDSDADDESDFASVGSPPSPRPAPKHHKVCVRRVEREMYDDPVSEPDMYDSDDWLYDEPLKLFESPEQEKAAGGSYVPAVPMVMMARTPAPERKEEGEISDDGPDCSMQIRACVVRVEDERPVDGDVKIYVAKAKEGMVLEEFLADTGANRMIHPSARSATSFYRMKLKIGTASGASSMVSALAASSCIPLTVIQCLVLTVLFLHLALRTS